MGIIGNSFITFGEVVKGVNFEIGVDSLTKASALSGIADGKVGHFFTWIDIPTAFATQSRIINLPSNRFIVNIPLSGNMISIIGVDSGSTNALVATMASNAPLDVYFGLAISWDLTDINKFQMFQVSTAGVWSDLSITPSTHVNTNINYSAAGTTTIASKNTGPTASGYDLAGLVFNPAEYLDWSLTANQEKIYKGKPLPLGEDARTLTGTAPIVYLAKNANEAAVDFGTNKGTGGGFTVNGTLTDSATNP